MKDARDSLGSANGRVNPAPFFDRGLGENFDAPKPDYLERRDRPGFEDFSGWYSAQRLAKALEAALAEPESRGQRA
jgi:hypothetical protein